jgi:hypothetical protein
MTATATATSPVETRRHPEEIALSLCVRMGEAARNLVREALRKQETPEKTEHMLQTARAVEHLLS